MATSYQLIYPLGVIRDVDLSVKVGEGTKVWAFARILADVVIGRHVNIGGGTEIGKGSTIGDESRIGANCFFPPHSVIGAKVFVGPGVICCDDLHPKVPEPGDPPYDAKPPMIDDGASIGAGAVILPGVRIGKHARIAAGAVVTKDVPAGMVVKSDVAARVSRLSRETEAKWLTAETFPS